MPGSCGKMIDLETALLPVKKHFNVPVKLVKKSDVFGRKVVAVCCDPILLTVYLLAIVVLLVLKIPHGNEGAMCTYGAIQSSAITPPITLLTSIDEN